MEPDLRAGTVCLVLIWSRLVLLAHSQVYCPDLCNCYDNIDPDGYTYTVDCSYGEITSIPGFIPVNTTHLDLSYNYIGKVRKSDLAGLSMLVFLQLHDNLIAEIEPGSFSDLTSLQALFIYDNNIRELAAGALAGLGSLLELDAHNMHLKSFAGGVFSPLSSAYYIDLSDNRLGTLPPNAFTGLPKLQTLILNGSYIQSIQTAAFTNLPSLQVLNLDDNGLMHVAQAAFVSLPSIHTISLQMNQFVCDCDAVWLYGWLVKKGVAGPLCTYPAPLLGRPLLQLKPQDICRPPSVAMATPPYVVLNQSATLLLFCNASGAPPPKVHWSVNGFTFYPNDTRVTSNDTSLKIANVGVNDSGMYYCCASSGSLSVSSSVYVTVLDVVSENNISSIAAYVGTTAQVPCVIRPLPVPLPVTWMFQKNVLQASPKYTITANSTLLVNNTSLSDGGLYQCVVGGATVLMRRVTVIAPPTITRFLHGPCSSPQSISLNTSSVGDFVCDAFGSPPPSIQWLYNGAPLSPSNPVDTYYSPRVVQSANMTRTFLTSQNIIGGVMVIGTEVGGNYTCVASNPYGSDVKSTLVDIVAALQPPAQITISMKPIDAFVKQYLVLPCVVVAPVNVSVSITWSGPTPIPSDAFVTSSNSLVFVEPMGGRYTCHTQGGGASFNIEYDISIQNPPLIVKECPVPVVSCLLGQTAWLFCNATGAPPPQVTWYMGGVMIQSSGRYKVGPLGYPGALVISMATIEDTGVYTCVASNSYNEMDSYTISLQVLKRPYFTQSPSSVGVAKTAPAQLQCSGAGLPLPAVTWWKVNSTISMATQVQPSNGTVISSEYLVILRASVLDMGYYYCNLSSPVGVVTSPQAYINVYTAPVFMSSPSEVKTVEGTTNVSLPAPPPATPLPPSPGTSTTSSCRCQGNKLWTPMETLQCST